MIERGVVTEVEGGEATVSFVPSGSCASCRGCASTNGGKRMVMRVKTHRDVRSGDTVTVEVNPRAVLSSAFLVFLLPLIMFVIGTLAAVPLFGRAGLRMNRNLAGILVGLGLMILTFAFVFVFERRASRVSALSPRIVEIERKAPSPPPAEDATSESEDDND